MMIMMTCNGVVKME